MIQTRTKKQVQQQHSMVENCLHPINKVYIQRERERERDNDLWKAKQDTLHTFLKLRDY